MSDTDTPRTELLLKEVAETHKLANLGDFEHYHSLTGELAGFCRTLERELAELRKNPRDEYHTMEELYDYRMLYNIHAAHGWLAAGIPVVKSWKHSDGEPCFGGGWFVVVATLPAGQVSNHYKAEHWDKFQVPEVELPPEYDGHTPADAAERLRAPITF